jgi:hypothetical protein
MDIINVYKNIINSDTLANSNALFFYKADYLKSNVLATNILEIDIASAFPNICKMLLGHCEFVSKIFDIDNKIERNIFISTELTKGNYKISISDLNNWSKIIIFGYVFSLYNNIDVLEFKKDSLLFKAIQKPSHSDFDIQFIDWLLLNDLKFHINKIDTYIRINKTSFYYDRNRIITKGFYKNVPNELNNIILGIINGRILYDNVALNKIKNMYSDLFLNILVKSGLTEYISNYFSFDGKFITHDGKLVIAKTYIDIPSICSPFSYLQFIIFPIISLLKNRKL